MILDIALKVQKKRGGGIIGTWDAYVHFKLPLKGKTPNNVVLDTSLKGVCLYHAYLNLNGLMTSTSFLFLESRFSDPSLLELFVIVIYLLK
jgi:hypothetical protein